MSNLNLQVSIESGNKVSKKYAVSHRKKNVNTRKPISGCERSVGSIPAIVRYRPPAHFSDSLPLTFIVQLVYSQHD